MVLSSDERAHLFSTDSISLQMQRFLSMKATAVTIKEMRDIWSDISKGVFLSSLYSLETRGLITIKDDAVKIHNVKPQRGEILEAVWRAARLRKMFTVEDILEDLPKYSSTQVASALNSLVAANGIAKVGKTTGRHTLVNIYKVIQDTPVRPKVGHENNHRENTKADLVWEICKEFGSEFTAGQVRDALKEQGITISQGYLRQIFKIWIEDDILERDRKDTPAYCYRIIGEARTSVKKRNRKWATGLLETIKEKGMKDE